MTDRFHNRYRVVPVGDLTHGTQARFFPETLAKIPVRFFIYHLYPVSARLQFFCLGDRHLCVPFSLPALSDLLTQTPKNGGIAPHPAQLIDAVAKALEVERAELTVTPGFRYWVDTPRQVFSVYLLQHTGFDPFTPPEYCRWVELTERYRLPAVEQEILQIAYQRILA